MSAGDYRSSTPSSRVGSLELAGVEPVRIPPADNSSFSLSLTSVTEGKRVVAENIFDGQFQEKHK